MLQRLRRWFAYDEWANREVLRAFRQPGAPTARSLKLLAHILGAEWVWYERLAGEKQGVPVWPQWTPERIEAEIFRLRERWAAYLNSLREEDLEGEFEYRNSKGETHHSRREDVLVHVVMHAAYHRGQIASDLRGAGLEPAYTDFIHATRTDLL